MKTIFYHTNIRPLGVLFLAFLAAVVVTFGVLQIFAWRADHLPMNARKTTPSEEEKLRMLASLTATSTPPIEERSQILHALSSDAAGPADEEKLKVLESLKP